MNDTIRPSHRDGEPTGATTAPDLSATAATAAAERRRQALRGFLDRHRVTPAELARISGMPSGNLIYNFLRGRTDSLAQPTLEKIMRAFPGTTITELTGWNAAGDAGPDTGRRTVIIVCEAQAGLWRSGWRLAQERWTSLSLPEGFQVHDGPLFGVRVCRPGAEQLYPDGALLVCQSLDGPAADLPDGCRLVVRHERNGRTEVTVRELRRHEGLAFLWPHSDRPDYQQPLRLQETAASPSERRRDGVVLVAGLVRAAWCPQAGPSGK
jgi:hypothetical protein